jgi:hypothetical protein
LNPILEGVLYISLGHRHTQLCLHFEVLASMGS